MAAIILAKHIFENELKIWLEIIIRCSRPSAQGSQAKWPTLNYTSSYAHLKNLPRETSPATAACPSRMTVCKLPRYDFDTFQRYIFHTFPLFFHTFHLLFCCWQIQFCGHFASYVNYHSTVHSMFLMKIMWHDEYSGIIASNFDLKTLTSKFQDRFFNHWEQK